MHSAWSLFRSSPGDALLRVALRVRAAVRVVVMAQTLVWTLGPVLAGEKRMHVLRAVGRDAAIALRTAVTTGTLDQVSRWFGSEEREWGPEAGAGPGVRSRGSAAGDDSRHRDTSPRVRVANPPVPVPRRLTDTRVRRLQRAILSRVLVSQCGVVPDRREAEDLAQWSSVAWVRQNLLNAAGWENGRKVPVDEYIHRCEVVYPAVVGSLRLELARDDPAGGTDRTGAVAVRHGLLPNGAIGRSLYPEEITRYRRSLRRAEITRITAEQYRRDRRRAHLDRFAWYGQGITILASVGSLPPGRAERVLRALEHQFLT